MEFEKNLNSLRFLVLLWILMIKIYFYLNRTKIRVEKKFDLIRI